MSETTKSRKWFDCPVSGINRSSGFASFSPYSSLGPESSEEVTGSTHYRLHGGNGWSGGGPVFINRDTQRYVPNLLNYQRFAGGGALLTQGSVRIENPTTAVTSLSAYAAKTNLELIALGTTAIARTEPTSPAFDLSVFLGELRAEGLPNLPGHSVMEKTRLARKGGGEYLNVEFGWAPLVRGIKDFAHTVAKSDEIIRLYREGANKPLNRRYDFPSLSDSRLDLCSFSMTPGVAFFTGGGRYQRIEQTIWFEGEYIYYLPSGGSAGENISRFGSYARKLLGLDLSPEVLWNLSPWSWAADWFGNVGDVAHNFSAFGTDGLVLRHGYIMCHTRKLTQDHGSVSGLRQVKTRVQETKQRLPATPYGFGVVYSGLTPKQIAILAALGLSRW